MYSRLWNESLFFWDSNVIIAAFAARGFCDVLFEHCLENHEIVICEAILDEISEKLAQKVGLPKRYHHRNCFLS